mgnify:FL=1
MADLPEVVQSVFSANVVAVVFVVSILLNLILPEDMELERIQIVETGGQAFRQPQN